MEILILCSSSVSVGKSCYYIVIFNVHSSEIAEKLCDSVMGVSISLDNYFWQVDIVEAIACCLVFGSFQHRDNVLWQGYF